MYTSSFFYSVRIETAQVPLKVAAASVFCSVYATHAACFDECFLIHVVTGRRYFYETFVVTFFKSRFFQPPYCCFP